jgi:hypothetical protein
VDDHGECHPERSAQRESKDLRLQSLAPQGASASMADRAVRAARTYLFSYRKNRHLLKKIVLSAEADHGFIVSGAVEKSASLFPPGHVGRKKFLSKNAIFNTPEI